MPTLRRAGRAASGWLLGTGLLAWHISIFLLAATALLLLNLYRDPNQVSVQAPLARWGLVIVFHASLVAASRLTARAAEWARAAQAASADSAVDQSEQAVGVDAAGWWTTDGFQPETPTTGTHLPAAARRPPRGDGSPVPFTGRFRRPPAAAGGSVDEQGTRVAGQPSPTSPERAIGTAAQGRSSAATAAVGRLVDAAAARARLGARAAGALAVRSARRLEAVVRPTALTAPRSPTRAETTRFGPLPGGWENGEIAPPAPAPTPPGFAPLVERDSGQGDAAPAISPFPQPAADPASTWPAPTPLQPRIPAWLPRDPLLDTDAGLPAVTDDGRRSLVHAPDAEWTWLEAAASAWLARRGTDDAAPARDRAADAIEIVPPDPAPEPS